MSGITFSSEPAYGKSVSLLVLAPAGVEFSTEEIGNHLFGAGKWVPTEPPRLNTLPRDIAARGGFRLSEEEVDWSEFLKDVYSTVDFVFYFNPFKKLFAEISRGNLEYQKPVYYGYTFLAFYSEKHVPLKKSTPDIPPAAYAPAEKLRPLKPFPAAAPAGEGTGRADAERPGRPRRGARTAQAERGEPMRHPQLVCVDSAALSSMLDALVEAAHGAVGELDALRSLLDH
jgi:hypothetical protein